MASRVDLKVVLLGKEYGGKTSLVERYIHGKFNSSAPYQSVRLDIVAPLFSSRLVISRFINILSHYTVLCMYQLTTVTIYLGTCF